MNWTHNTDPQGPNVTLLRLNTDPLGLDATLSTLDTDPLGPNSLATALWISHPCVPDITLPQANEALLLHTNTIRYYQILVLFYYRTNPSSLYFLIAQQILIGICLHPSQCIVLTVQSTIRIRHVLLYLSFLLLAIRIIYHPYFQPTYFRPSLPSYQILPDPPNLLSRQRFPLLLSQ